MQIESINLIDLSNKTIVNSNKSNKDLSSSDASSETSFFFLVEKRRKFVCVLQRPYSFWFTTDIRGTRLLLQSSQCDSARGNRYLSLANNDPFSFTVLAWPSQRVSCVRFLCWHRWGNEIIIFLFMRITLNTKTCDPYCARTMQLINSVFFFFSYYFIFGYFDYHF